MFEVCCVVGKLMLTSVCTPGVLTCVGKYFFVFVLVNINQLCLTNMTHMIILMVKHSVQQNNETLSLSCCCFLTKIKMATYLDNRFSVKILVFFYFR